MSYEKMAKVYDLLMADAPYEKWLDFTKEIFKQYGTNINQVADLGCGTGKITRDLAKAGYQLTGVDYSEDMLTLAQQSALEEKLDIEWIKQDVRYLDGLSQKDAVVSYCDVLNYITEENDVKKVFQHVFETLRDDGLFIFDVHSLNHVESNLKGNTFAEIYDDVTYVWLCQEGNHIGEVFHDLTFFLLDVDQYERFDEEHHQRTFPPELYDQWLTLTGFEKQGIFRDFSLEETNLNSEIDGQRVFFVYKKIRGN